MVTWFPCPSFPASPVVFAHARCPKWPHVSTQSTRQDPSGPKLHRGRSIGHSIGLNGTFFLEFEQFERGKNGRISWPIISPVMKVFNHDLLLSVSLISLIEVIFMVSFGCLKVLGWNHPDSLSTGLFHGRCPSGAGHLALGGQQKCWKPLLEVLV